jgi:poly(hydroxyalkanoate) depolymerase family esterase
MRSIDWQELYAANRAAIARHGIPESGLPSTPGGGSGARLPRLPVRLPGDDPPTVDDSPGSWEARTYFQDGRARPYHVYTPPTVGRDTPAPLVVMLHGCTQTASVLAAGTRMNHTADRHGFVVAYPEQTGEHNPGSCWNWFVADQQSRRAGEPEFIAEVARAVLGATARWTIDPARVYVAGMSAGGAMAAVMGATYPDVFAAVAIHSGLAYASADGQAAAYAAMARGAPDPERQGASALRAMGGFARPVPVTVIHGTADEVVAPVNGDLSVRQWMATNRLAAGGAYAPHFDHPASRVAGRVDGGHAYTRARWTDREGRLLQEYVKVDGLGHAWSGGARGGSYTDPRGPSASDAIWRFFAEAGPS